VSDDHARFRDDLAAYMLGALDRREREELESHLETCEECSERLRWLGPAAELLSESVERRDPPPALRERIMAEVRAEAEPREAAPPAPQPRRSWRNFLLRPAIAVAGAALLAAGAAGYLVGGEGGGDTTVGPQTSGGITASLIRDGDSGTLELTGLSQLPAGAVYQAWVQQGKRVIPSSLFAARADGSATAAIPRDLDGAERVMVTREPRGGSRRPTGPPLVSVGLQQS
jgi:anti-sigma-K factor RskA